MYGVFWHAVVKEGRKEELLKFLEWDAQVARDKEPGTVSFDVYQDPEDDNAIFVYEAYRDEAAFGEHRENGPYQKWRAGGLREELVAEVKVLSGFSNSLVSRA
jgi:autoinducer 2-degrading protein